MRTRTSSGRGIRTRGRRAVDALIGAGVPRSLASCFLDNGQSSRSPRSYLNLRIPLLTMRGEVAHAIRRCGRVRWLAPAPAVVVGGRRSCRGGGAGWGGGCPHRSTPDRCFPAAGVADGRPMAASRPAHTSGRVRGPVVFGRDHLRIDRLSAADPLGPATRWFPREGPDRGTELRHVSRDGAVSLSSPSVGRRCADGAENRSWWWRSLAVDGSSGTSRGHPSVMRRPDEAIRSSRRASDL